MSFLAQNPPTHTAIAYGFLTQADEHTGVCHNRFVQIFTTAASARSALACAAADVQVMIVDGALQEEVSPLNLAAALHKDNPLRDIYVQQAQPNALFVSRALAAGARGVMSIHEAEELLGLPQLSEGAVQISEPEDNLSPRHEAGEDTNSLSDDSWFAEGESAPWAYGFEEEVEEISFCAKPSARVAKQPAGDLAWLEHVLELESLDELEAEYASATPATPAASSASATSGAPATPGGMSSSPLLPDLQAHTAPLKTPVMALNSTPPLPQPALFSGAEAKKSATVAAFVSGRGGVGKSSLAALTAMQLWKDKIRVAVLDMDMQFGDMSMLLGNEAQSSFRRVGLEHLCRGHAQLSQLDGELLIIEPPEQPELAEELVQCIPLVLSTLRKLAQVVIVNTSCLWDEAAAVLAQSADNLVICMDQRATSISAARKVVDLCTRLHIPSTHLKFLLNRCARNAPITNLDASLAMGGVDIITIAEGGADVDELLSLGCPLETLSAQLGLQQSIKTLAADIIAQPGTANSEHPQAGLQS